MRQKVIEPTCSKFMILNASIDSGSLSSGLRSVGSPVLTSMPL